MASGPRRRPRNTSRPARIVRSLSETRPIAVASMAKLNFIDVGAGNNWPRKRPAGLEEHLACCLVRFLCQMVQELGELPCLTDKESISGERLDGRYGAGKSVIGRPNYCAERQIRADEFARNREDQAGLNQVGRLQRWVIEKIRKRQPAVGHRCYRRLHAIARKFDPFEKVGDLVPAN